MTEPTKARTGTKKLGTFGEELVCRYLIKMNWRILERNLRIGRSPEIDVVAQAPCSTIVFIEVKSRQIVETSSNCLEQSWLESALDTVSRGKQNKILRLAEIYLRQRHREGKLDHRFEQIRYRFDIIFLGISSGAWRSTSTMDDAEVNSSIDCLLSAYAGFEGRSADLMLIHCENAFAR